ncbi:MAG: cation:proton antiporter [Burkholderiales bacterium]
MACASRRTSEGPSAVPQPTGRRRKSFGENGEGTFAPGSASGKLSWRLRWRRRPAGTTRHKKKRLDGSQRSSSHDDRHRLGLAVVLGLLAVRLKLPALVGYLLAGILIEPFTPGFVADAGMASRLAEISVMLLMFGVGLHFSLNDLMSTSRSPCRERCCRSPWPRLSAPR